jgi:hypothetical protein
MVEHLQEEMAETLLVVEAELAVLVEMLQVLQKDQEEQAHPLQ